MQLQADVLRRPVRATSPRHATAAGASPLAHAAYADGGVHALARRAPVGPERRPERARAAAPRAPHREFLDLRAALLPFIDRAGQ